MIVRQCPTQTHKRHLWATLSSPRCLRGLTTTGHTLGRCLAPLVCGQSPGFDPIPVAGVSGGTTTSLETTDDGNEDNIQHLKIYAKDSLDRFGDDLFCILLSYLSLEDRFRCECVSKQFQRTVFDSETMTQTMETFAIKCPNIETIDCRGMILNEQTFILLDTLRDNCQHLREIYVRFGSTSDEWTQLLQPLITRMIIDWQSDPKESIINNHRLSHLSISSIDKVFDNTSGQLMAKNLLTFEFTFKGNDINSQLLSRFVADNQSLRCLVVNTIIFLGQNSVRIFADQLSRLTQLRELTLDLWHYDNSLADSLRTIGVNCKQLKRLSLVLKTNEGLGVQTLDSLQSFRRLKRLDLTLGSNQYWFWGRSRQKFNISVPGLKIMHLSLNLQQIVCNLLNNYQNHSPLLQCLSNGCQNYGTECLSHLSRLPALQTLDFWTTDLRNHYTRDHNFQ
ncbi:unnamed protein product [Medioppia subpectinata]|uniref:F-box domain-containing protein n=1 Tax=Medioppia subpectinata TaxID=1979941 RepID=A0A7R9KTF6_9ACAR|nr:unnamed protein product [Medioppia subpectinata]CAG2109407.1 unnamed protein product [Medioppia subpectinata]